MIPITINKNLRTSLCMQAKPWSRYWPWLLSLGLHSLLLAFLCYGLWQVGANSSQPASPYLVNLLPASAQLAKGSQQTQQASMAASSPSPTVAVNSPPQPSRETNRPSRNNNTVSMHMASSAASATEEQSGAISATRSLGPYLASEVDQRPRLLRQVEPVYPAAAKRRGLEGWVEIKFLVNRQGIVSQETIVTAQPAGVFENSALNALRQWRFSPGLLQGQAVDTWVVQVIRFRLSRAG